MSGESPEEKKRRDENPWRQLGQYSHLALVLPASVIAGIAIGAGLDRWLKTSWLTLVGLLLGCVAGFTELIRALVKMNKES